MTRSAALAWCLALALPVTAEDPPAKPTADERKALAARRKELDAAGDKAYQASKLADAAAAFAEIVKIDRRLYPTDTHPDGHPDLADGLNNLGFMYQNLGRLADAEPLFVESLAMSKRLYKGDHPKVATGLNNLAAQYQLRGRPADAEPLAREALGMARRLYKGDHPEIVNTANTLAAVLEARGKCAEAEPLYREALDRVRRMVKGDDPELALALNNLGGVYRAQGKFTEAEALFRDALDMRKRLFKGDHPDVAEGLNNLAAVSQYRGKFADAERLYRAAIDMNRRLYPRGHPNLADAVNNLATLYEAGRQFEEAEPLYRESLAMARRLFRGDHPAVATGLNNVAFVCHARGKYDEAEPLYRDALAMRRRLYAGDHPDVAQSVQNLAIFARDLGKHEEADRLYRDALAMGRRLLTDYADRKSEGEALTLLASLPLTRDGFLASSLAGRADPAAVYAEVWASKGAVARVYERRRQAARAARDPEAVRLLADLAAARRRRAELLLTPAVRGDRKGELADLDKAVADTEDALRSRLPVVARAGKLAAAAPADLRAALPSDAAVVDYLRYVRVEQDPTRPGRAGQTVTARYVAFVVTRDAITRVELGAAGPIEAAVARWRAAITGGTAVPPALSAEVRERVWAKVRRELPAAVKVVYVSPDTDLARVPWPALPGDRPGTVLLDDFALATTPHAAALLDRLLPQDPLPDPPTGVLVVGGVRYDASPVGLPARPAAKVEWLALPGTAAEAAGVARFAEARRQRVTQLGDERATPAAVLVALPKVRVAHLATHGFFADAAFRSAFRLDEADFERSAHGDRRGRAANNPLVMTGLVLAGANDPTEPGRGIVTGEALVDLDLTGLELAVLSACETGLGDVADGEGTFGLQRAFHLAGTRDVVASLWKVPDEPTAALMGLFYRNYWEKALPPIEALRQAQLEVYRHPDRVPGLAKAFRGEFKVVPGAGVATATGSSPDGTVHPLHWAAFTLSGPGR